MIDRVKVDQIDIRSLDAKVGFSIHFNVLDGDGHPMPGLGGRLGPHITQRRREWRVQADAMIANIRKVAHWWIDRLDEYEVDVVTLVFVDAMRYDKTPEGGHGINFLFRRDDDMFQSALLLTRSDRDDPRIWHNQKRWIEDDELSDKLDTDIMELFNQATALVLAVNKARNIRRRDAYE